MKPGYKTTEFWLSFAAVLVGFLIASGAIADGGVVMKGLVAVGAMLTAAGYTVSRGIAKKAELQARAQTNPE